MKAKSPLLRLLYWARDLRSRALFGALREHCRGDVLDVGGWDFFLTADAKQVPFERWTTLEHDQDRLLKIEDARVHVAYGDGCRMSFESERFDTVLNIQVLEHVFEPIRMVEECARVLKPGGKGIFLIPTTSTMHLAPHYHYNFSRFWIREAFARGVAPAGGHLVHLCLSSFVLLLAGLPRSRNDRPPDQQKRPFLHAFPAASTGSTCGDPRLSVLVLGGSRGRAEQPSGGCA
jgi:SAM-dependent methyltransferase